jgi:LysR family glycine cleavage system transcriptional activator
MRKIPPLTAVRVFEAAARHENFTKAAAELGMTQAAVSYQIRVLEERLGTQLFTRDRKRVRLSDSARRIAPQISGAFDTLAAAFSEMEADNENVLAVTTTYTFASNWLAPRLGGFQVRRPELAVRLRTDNRLIDFAGEEIDMGIRTGRGGWKGLREHFLFNFYSTPMCSPDFLREHPMREPADVLQVPRMGAGDPWWGRWLECAGVSEPESAGAIGYSFDSQVSEGNAAMAGHGIAMLSPTFWKAELAAGRLVAPFPIVSFDGFSYWLVYPEHKRNQPKIRAFREWLLAEIAVDAELGPSEVFTPPEPVDPG